ncbi:MAG: OmpA family protein [Alphaproteobacteria bacterium]
MFRRGLTITTSAVALTLAAVTAPVEANWLNDILNDDIAEVRKMNAEGSDFSAHLAREYRQLALFEADAMYDFPASDYFADKALAVRDGRDEIPAVPQIWDIEPALMDELIASREQLTAAFRQDAKALAPQQAATAQAKYDCWVEQTEEGYAYPWQSAHIVNCKEAFRSAMSELDRAIDAARPAPVAVAPAAPQDPTYVPTDDRAVVYFDFDQARITPDAQATIDRLVERVAAGRNIVVTVEGHADRSGPADYNRELSRERALAVREALLRHGLDVRDVRELNIVAEGESDPLVETGDGVRHPKNRRAEIAAYRLQPAAAGTFGAASR